MKQTDIRKRAAMVLVLVLTAMTAWAQQTLYVMKDGQAVATHDMAGDDYVTFHRPDDAQPQQAVTLQGMATGKNYIQYRVTTATPAQYYAHGFYQASTLDAVLQYYYATKLDDADESVIEAALRMLLQYQSYTDQGTEAYTITNGANDGGYTDFFIPGGQDFYVATCNLLSVDDQGGTAQMGSEMQYVKLTTLTPGQSGETVSIEYKGLNDDDEATYAITPSSGVVTLYTMLAKKKELDQNTSIYGFDKVFFGAADPWTAADWANYGDQQAWTLDGEDDYVMTVVGIDANGDWTTATHEQHIMPASDNCPKINVVTQEAAAGKVTIGYEISPASVTEAHVRLMLENDLNDSLNIPGTTLQQLATGGDAEDITEAINASGAATFTRSNLKRGWYTLLVSATDPNGTTVVRIGFHSHLTDALWEIVTSTFPTATEAKPQKAPRISLAPRPSLLSSNPDTLFVVSQNTVVGTYELGTEADAITFTKPGAEETNVFNVDTETNRTKSAFYALSDDGTTLDLYLTIADIDDAKLFDDCRQTVHLQVPVTALGSPFDITGDTPFQLDFANDYGNERYSFSTGQTGSATGTVSVSRLGTDAYAVSIDLDGFGHTLRLRYAEDAWQPYDLSTPNAYAWGSDTATPLRSAVVTHTDGLYTVYLSQREGVTTLEGMADADIIAVTPEEFLGDGIKGFSGDETRAKVSITHDGVTYCQANTTNGGSDALGSGGNVSLLLEGNRLTIDFMLFGIKTHGGANMLGHYEGTATVVE